MDNEKEEEDEDEEKEKGRRGDEVVVGRWGEEDLLRGRKFDVIILDYLIGSIDGFEPYTQDMIFGRLGVHLAEGGRMYVVGMEPIPDQPTTGRSTQESGEDDNNHTQLVIKAQGLVCEMRRLRDACILLAGHRCYREFPLSWIHRQISSSTSSLHISNTKSFSILHSPSSFTKQLNVARSKLEYMDSEVMREGMRIKINELENMFNETLKKMNAKNVPLSFDYIVQITKDSCNNT